MTDAQRYRDEAVGLRAALDASEAECQRLRERLAICDAARQTALADLTAAEMHLDQLSISVPSLPQPDGMNGTEWAQDLAMYLNAIGGCFSFSAAHGMQAADAQRFATAVDALIRQWPARRERLLAGGS